MLLNLGYTQIHRYSFEHQQMGTLFRIVMYSPDSLLASQAASAAFGRIDNLNQSLSDYHPESELNLVSSLSGEDTCISLSQDLEEILRLSQQMYHYSQGAFDITIGPLVQLWRRAKRRRELPPADKIEEARKSVSSSYMVWDSVGRCLRLTQAQMRLDLGGIAKGYAVDEAMGVLKTYGIHQALVDGGGDLVLGDPPPDKPGWEVKMEYVDATAQPRDTVLILSNLAIASSGDAYRNIEIGGKRYSHIMDPHSGFGLVVQRKVTVVAPQGVWADAWASALSILGPSQGFSQLNKFPEIKGLILELNEEKLEAYISEDFFDLIHSPSSKHSKHGKTIIHK